MIANILSVPQQVILKVLFPYLSPLDIKALTVACRVLAGKLAEHFFPDSYASATHLTNEEKCALFYLHNTRARLHVARKAFRAVNNEIPAPLGAICIHRGKLYSSQQAKLGSPRSDTSISVRNVMTMTCGNRKLEGHTGLVTDINSYGECLASSSEDTTIRIWHPDEGTLKATLKGHTNRVNRIEIRRQYVWSLALDDSMALWDLVKGCLQYPRFSTVSEQFSLQGENIVSMHLTQTAMVKVWNPDQKQSPDRPGAKFYLGNGDFRSIKAYEQNIYAGDESGIRCWDLRKSNFAVATLRGGDTLRGFDIADRLLFAKFNQNATVWDLTKPTDKAYEQLGRVPLTPTADRFIKWVDGSLYLKETTTEPKTRISRLDFVQATAS